VEEFYSKLAEITQNELLESNPDVLGVSLYTSTLPASLFGMKLAKKLFPDIKIVVGGSVF
jgi:hypothetical protein